MPTFGGRQRLSSSTNNHQLQGTENSTMASIYRAHNVKYIPPQMDPLAGSSISALHSSPALLVLRDLRVLLSNLRYLPYIIVPLTWMSDDDELNPLRAGAKILLLQGLLFIVETILLSVSPLVWLVFPGITSSLVVIASLGLVYLMVTPMDGPRIVHSSVGVQTPKDSEQHQDERWIFINGCVVGFVYTQPGAGQA